MATCEDHDWKFYDDDDLGVCEKCGAECEWHWERDTGNVGDCYWDGRERVVDTVYEPEQLGD